MLKTYIKHLSTATLLLFGALAASEAVAQTPLAQYNFTGAAGNEDSIAVDAQPANGRFYHARRGAALTGTAGGNYITSNNWPTAFSATAYHSVGGRANAGYSMTLTSMAFTVRHSSSGPGTFELRSSLDNYTAVLKTVTVPSATTADVRDSLALPAAFANLTSKVEFRIFGYNATATTGTGRLDKVKFYGSIQPTGAPLTPTVGFAASTSSVVENIAGGTTTVSINIANPSATAATTVNVGLGTGSTATAGTDFTFTGSTLTWAAGDNAPKTVTVTIIDDAIYDPAETIVLALTNPSTGATIGTATHTITITDNELPTIPTVTVASITVNDPVNFLPTQLNQVVKLVGVLHGVNQRAAGAGLQLTLIDNTGGVGIFTTNNAIVPAVAPIEGDRVRAIGTVGHFNGLTQLNLDSIVVISHNQPLVTPTVVNGPLTEAHESELVTLANPVHLVTPSQWVTTGTGFTAQVTDGVNTYDMRVVATSNIWGTPAPTGQFVLTGIGGQFDSTDPRDSGYQITPRRLTDLRNVTGISEDLSNAVSLYPNPVANVLNLSGFAGKNATVSVVNTLGQVVKTVPAAAQINVANLPAGVYTLRITTEKGTAAKRFVKVN